MHVDMEFLFLCLNTVRETLPRRAPCVLFVSTELKMEIGHRKDFLKLTFQALAVHNSL